MTRNSQPWSFLLRLADLLLFLSFIVSLFIAGWDGQVVWSLLLEYVRIAEVVFSLLVPPTTVAPASVVPETGILMSLMGVASFFGFGMVGALDPSYRFPNASVRRDYAWMVIAIFLSLFMLLPPLLSITHWLPTYLSDTILIAYCALQGAYAIGSAYAIKLLISQG